MGSSVSSATTTTASRTSSRPFAKSPRISTTRRVSSPNTERAEEATRHVEEVVKSLTSSHSLSKQTHEQLRQLNALAQHVNQKLRSLGATKELVDRANAQMNEVNEVVWDVDRKVKKLADQSQWVKEIEGSVERFQERNCLPLWVDQGDGGVVGSTKD